MEIEGLDTMFGLKFGMPEGDIEIEHSLIASENMLRPAWGAKYINLLLYCAECRVPLTWHTPIEEDKVIFHCPECKARWTKGDERKK